MMQQQIAAPMATHRPQVTPSSAGVTLGVEPTSIGAMLVPLVMLRLLLPIESSVPVCCASVAVVDVVVEDIAVNDSDP